eukprot:CAMPEP_0183733400 /NCGR_PEP_ID=MMETSP0737-20130205/41057_1 /TAXON_ID=385413 /ORGANISM="Thalassiosira miniscula, Strain CCMP1093" /LENGTH=54 /DNA_ID=CAMNT_0025966649 /DNA_START=30 /DNA_END=191 /DNA_ORIENTATION=+
MAVGAVAGAGAGGAAGEIMMNGNKNDASPTLQSSNEATAEKKTPKGGKKLLKGL